MPKLIEQQDEFEGVRLSWPLPSPGHVRYLVAAFFAFGTYMWVLGFISGLRTLIQSRDPEMGTWIAAWTLGGGWMPMGMWGILRRRPESVLLGNELIYDRGWDMASPAYFAGLASNTMPVFPGKPMVVPKGDVELDGGRMGFQHRGKRVEIGMFLPQSDREWLLAELERWRGK
jgi:hypothetical protein